MSYRDDHDAAIARAAALEQELAKARAESADKDVALARLARDKKRLAEDLARAEAVKPPVPHTPLAGDERPPTAEPMSGSSRVFLGGLTAMMVLGVFAYIRNGHRDRASEDADRSMRDFMQSLHAPSPVVIDPMCEIESSPSGASITLVSSSERRYLGTTPLTIKRSMLGPVMSTKLEAQLDDRIATLDISGWSYGECNASITLP